MKKVNIKLLTIGIGTVIILKSFAGNTDRIGQGGGFQLLLNPYAKSAGMAGINGANAVGMEAQFSNVAGMAKITGMNATFNNSFWLIGSGLNLLNFGFCNKVGETGAIGLSFSNITAGQIIRTTAENTEGGIGYFTPRFSNIAFSYAKAFSDYIYAGTTIRIINEGIDNVQATGVSLDAGVQYQTGDKNQYHLGVALKNIGPPISYSGDGLTTQATVLNNAYGKSYQMSQNQKSSENNLPASLNISLAYDQYISYDSLTLKSQKITYFGGFTSNYFINDQFSIGAEYNYNNILMLRAGYAYESNILNKEASTTIFSGPSAGLSFEYPVIKEKMTLGVDYSIRVTNTFFNIQSVGIRVLF